jgi:hypothetical protein
VPASSSTSSSSAAPASSISAPSSASPSGPASARPLPGSFRNRLDSSQYSVARVVSTVINEVGVLVVDHLQSHPSPPPPPPQPAA